MKTAERIILVLILLVVVGGAAWIYFTMRYNHQQVVDAVARGEYEIRPEERVENNDDTKDWQRYYPNTVPLTIGEKTVLASVADSMAERIQGLSNTPYLPDNMVKLFAFGATGTHSIWMKDMNYALDIIWAAQDGTIVHIEENIAPETFPESFASPKPAWYVVEANAGFVASSSLKVGDTISTY